MEVERLQHQLMGQKISPDNFFAMLLSMFELDASKGFMRTIIDCGASVNALASGT